MQPLHALRAVRHAAAVDVSVDLVLGPKDRRQIRLVAERPILAPPAADIGVAAVVDRGRLRRCCTAGALRGHEVGVGVVYIADGGRIGVTDPRQPPER